MDKLFENKYTRDKEWAKDIHRYLYFRRPVMIVIHILYVLSLVVGIYTSIITSSVFWFGLLFPIFWCVLIIFLYNTNVNITTERDFELHGKAIDVTVTVAEDKIKQSQSTGSEYQLNYCDIKKAIQTKKYIYLWSNTNLIYSLKKDSFTFGAADDFLLFLNSKGIKVK